MIVNLYTFPNCGTLIPEDDCHELDFDNADDMYNPYCNENRKDSFFIEDAEALDSIKLLVLKHSIMFGDDFSFNDQFSKRQAFKANDKFLFNTMESIANNLKMHSTVSSHISNVINSNIPAESAKSQLSALSKYWSDDYQIKTYANVYSEFIQKYNDYNFIFRFQHYQYRDPIKSAHGNISNLRVNLQIKHI